jgi:hypothetical protein
LRIFQDGIQKVFGHRPFQGNTVGSALYASLPNGNAVVYRNRRVFLGGQNPIGFSSAFPLGATNVQKTAAIAFATSPADPSVSVPTSWHSSTVLLNVRTHECDCENEQLSGERSYTFDGSGNLVTQILGTATLTLSQKMDAGGWLFRFVYVQSTDGVQPVAFALHRTAGPTSPADVTTTFNASQRTYSLEVNGLTNAGAYTFEINAVNGSTSVVLLSGLNITADAAGPAAVSGLTAQEY